MEKTIVVQVESRFPHPMYAKTMIKTKKYLAHDDAVLTIFCTAALPMGIGMAA